MGKAVKDRACPKAQCGMFGKMGEGNVTFHGFLSLKRGTFRDVFTAVATFLSLLAVYNHSVAPTLRLCEAEPGQWGTRATTKCKLL